MWHSSAMAVERWTRERRRELTRTALLDAAAEVFARRGFSAASLDEIAEAAGYTRGAITFNFGSKEDLFLAVIERHNEALLAAYAQVLDRRPGNGEPELEEIAGVWKQFEAGDIDTLMLVLELRLYGLRNPDATGKVAAFERRMEETVGRFVADQAAAAHVRLPLPADELGAILYAATYGLQQHVALCPNNHEKMFEHLIELLVRSSDKTSTAPVARARKRT